MCWILFSFFLFPFESMFVVVHFQKNGRDYFAILFWARLTCHHHTYSSWSQYINCVTIIYRYYKSYLFVFRSVFVVSFRLCCNIYLFAFDTATSRMFEIRAKGVKYENKQEPEQDNSRKGYSATEKLHQNDN